MLFFVKSACLVAICSAEALLELELQTHWRLLGAEQQPACAESLRGGLDMLSPEEDWKQESTCESCESVVLVYRNQLKRQIDGFTKYIYPGNMFSSEWPRDIST